MSAHPDHSSDEPVGTLTRHETMTLRHDEANGWIASCDAVGLQALRESPEEAVAALLEFMDEQGVLGDAEVDVDPERFGAALRAVGFRLCPHHEWVRTDRPNCPRCSEGGMRWTAVR